MAKLLRSGKAFNEALCRIKEIMRKGSYDANEYNELQMLKWLVLEYEEQYGSYGLAVMDKERPFQDAQDFKIAL
jgi:hypothetical protein